LPNSIIYIFSIFTLFLIALLVTFKRRRRGNEAGRFLSLYYWFCLLSISISYLVLTPYLAYVPHLFRSAQFFILLMMPLSYLYFRQTLHDKPIGLADLLHLLPLLVFVIDYFPFFMLSGERKLEIWRGLNDYRLNTGFKEGWFMPEGAHIVIRYASMLTYWTLQFFLLYRLPADQRKDISRANPSQLRWFRWLLWTQAILILPSMLALLFVSKQLQSSILALSALVSTLLQGYFLFTHPEILYGIHSEPDVDGFSNPGGNKAGDEMAVTTGPESNSSYLDLVDEPTLDRIEALLNPLMEKEKLFLNPNLKVADLSTATGFGPHKLSAYFNKRCGLTFNDYINKQRVHYCAGKLESGEYKSKTLDALSSESGFQSRSTFIRAFKKCKGLTPSEFVQSVKQT
jgi:AraC-like DNA-binding protein